MPDYTIDLKNELKSTYADLYANEVNCIVKSLILNGVEFSMHSTSNSCLVTTNSKPDYEWLINRVSQEIRLSSMFGNDLATR